MEGVLAECMLYVINIIVSFSAASEWYADKSGQADGRNVSACHK